MSYIAQLKVLGPFLRQTLEKGRVLFLVTTSTSPSLQAYAELHALSPLRGSISWPGEALIKQLSGCTPLIFWYSVRHT